MKDQEKRLIRSAAMHGNRGQRRLAKIAKESRTRLEGHLDKIEDEGVKAGILEALAQPDGFDPSDPG